MLKFQNFCKAGLPIKISGKVFENQVQSYTPPHKAEPFAMSLHTLEYIYEDKINVLVQ